MTFGDISAMRACISIKFCTIFIQ